MSAAPLDIVFLRGLVRESAHWLDFPEMVRAAIPGANPIGLDILGSGRHHCAETPASMGEIVEALRRDFLAERAAAAARRGGRSAPAALVAISLGGMLAFEWMRRHPGDIARAVIMNSSLRGVSPFYRRLRPVAWTWFARALFERNPLSRERVILGLVSNRPERREETARRWVEIQRARPISLESFARQLAAAARHEPPEAPPPVPTLLLAGDEDRLCASDCSRDLALRFALPLETHPSAGHSLDLDEPEWTLARVREFLAPLAFSRGAAPALAATTGT